MPSKLPIKPRAQTRVKAIEREKAIERDEETDWLGLWALSMGFAAIVMATVAYFTAGDRIGASLILFGAAALIATVFHAGALSAKK